MQPLFSSIGPTLPFSFGSFVPRFGLSQRLVHCPSKPFETPLYQAFSAAAVGSFLQSSYVVQSQYCVAGSHSPAFGQTSKIGLHVDGSPRWYGRYWLQSSYFTALFSPGQYAPLMSTIGCTYS